MSYKITSQWNKLKVCVVGRAFPPEIFSFIKDVSLREKFEQLAIETEEDLYSLTRFLNGRGVKVVRPEIDTNLDNYKIDQGYMSPPISPRDFMCMIDDKLYFPGLPNLNHAWIDYCKSTGLTGYQNFETLENNIKESHAKSWQQHKKMDQKNWNMKLKFFDSIFTHVLEAGNEVVSSPIDYFNSSFITRLKDCLVLGTQHYHDDKEQIKNKWQKMFPNKKIFVKSTEGHSDGCYTPVNENLIISAYPDIDYSDIFPDAETVFVPSEVTLLDNSFAKAMHLSEDKFFMPDMEKDKKLVDMVEYYFSSWVGKVSETAFMVNILMLDEQNALCSSDNKQVREAMKRHGVELHIVPFRHRFFWDTGIHCLTQDLDRQ